MTAAAVVIGAAAAAAADHTVRTHALFMIPAKAGAGKLEGTLCWE
jgi:hypothetical protein